MNATAASVTAENVLISPSEALEEHLTETLAGALPEWVVDDGLPPPTHAQVEYWRQLCGALSLVKGSGVADGGWPADLAPTRPTLRALVDRGLIVRRKRAWHLKREWYTCLCSL